MKEKQVKEFFRTSYDGLLHEDHVPVDEFGEPIAGTVIHRTIQIHAEVHKLKTENNEPTVVDKNEDHRKKVEARLRELAEGG